MAERETFDRFWQSAVAGLALAARPPLTISVEDGSVRVSVRAGEVEPLPKEGV